MVILETIPPLVDSLQIIWMLSCHYNTDERMVTLMERIAWQLCERVGQVIDVHKLFRFVWALSHLCKKNLHLNRAKFGFTQM